MEIPMNASKFVEWLLKNGQSLKDNWKVVAGVLACVLAVQSATGLTLTVRSAAPGETPGVIIILPDDATPLVVQGAEVKPNVAEWVVAARLAIRVAIAVLERRAPNTPSERDDQLLAFLKLILGDRSAFLRADAAIRGG